MRQFHRYDKQYGHVFLLTLIFMQIFLLSGLYLLFSVRLQISNNQTHLHDIQMFYETLNELHQLTKMNVTKLNCHIAIINPNVLAKKPMNWWQQGCHDHRFYYVIEDLGEDHCGQIKWTQHAAHFLRFSVFYSSELNPIILQNTIAVQSTHPIECRSPHDVIAGEQMHRVVDINGEE